MKIIRFLFFVPFAMAGLFVIIFAFKQKGSDEKFFEKAKPVEAVIDEITTRTVRKGTGSKRKTRTEHDVFVTYTVNDVKYEHIEISSYSSSMSEGATMTLYYDPQNPKDIRDEGAAEMAFPLSLFMGSIFVLVGVGLPLGMVLAGNKGKKLMKNGIRCQAEEICLEENRNVRVNGKHPIVVYCRAMDPRDNCMKEFKSKNCYEDLYKYDIRNVDIYLDPNNMSKYYVDINGAIKAAKESSFY